MMLPNGNVKYEREVQASQGPTSPHPLCCDYLASNPCIAEIKY